MNGKNLTVDAKNSTVNNSATTTGTITITDVSNATWNEFATVNTILFSDPDKDAHFVVKKGGAVKKLTVTSPTAKVENEGIIEDLSVAKDSTVTLEGNVPVDATGEGKIQGSKGEEVKTEAEEQKEAEITNGTRFTLPETSKDMKTENILFLSKRVGVPNADKTKLNQLAITAETLKSAYDSLPESVTGKNFKGETIEVQTSTLPDTVKNAAFEPKGLTIDVSVQDGDLLLGNTTMTASLLSAIKTAEGASANTPYYITVTDGSKTDPKTKVARIAFSLVDGKVETKLVNLK